MKQTTITLWAKIDSVIILIAFGAILFDSIYLNSNIIITIASTIFWNIFLLPLHYLAWFWNNKEQKERKGKN